MNQTAVPLEPWCAGSKLLEPVLNGRGDVLLAAGATLSLNQVDALVSQGVRSVVLDLSEADMEANRAMAQTASEIPPHGPSPEQLLGRLQHLFRLGLREGTINPLFYLLKRYRSGTDT